MTDPLIASLLPTGKPASQGSSSLLATSSKSGMTALSNNGVPFDGAIEQAFMRLDPKAGATLPPQLLALLKQLSPENAAALQQTLLSPGQTKTATPFAWEASAQPTAMASGSETGANPLQQLLDTASEFMNNGASDTQTGETDTTPAPDFTAMAQFFTLPIRVEQTPAGTLLADGITVTPEATGDGRQNLPPVQRALAALQINTRRLDLLLQQAGVNLNDYQTVESLENPHFQRALAEILEQNGAATGNADIAKIMTFVSQVQQNPGMLAQLAQPVKDERLAQTPAVASAEDKSDKPAETAAKTIQDTAVKDLSESMKTNASVAAPAAMAQAQMPQDQSVTGSEGVGADAMGIESLGDNGPVSAQSAAPQTGGAKQAGASQPGFSQHLHEASVRDQVSVRIQQAAKEGVDKIAIKLNPPELGKVEISIEMGSDGISRLSVTADNRATFDMLQRSARDLEKSLLDAGLKADSGSLSFNLRGDGQQQQNPFANGNEKYPSYGNHKDAMDEDEALAALNGTSAGRTIRLHPDELNIVI